MHKNNILTSSPQNGLEVLSDKSSTGRERPWKKQKEDSLRLAAVYKSLSESGDDGYKHTEILIRECSSWLHFKGCRDGHIKQRLVKANFCKHRLCPMCQWRKSLFVYQQFLKVVHEAMKEKTSPNGLVRVQFALLTLTVRNMDSRNLKSAITHMLKSWRRLTARKPFKQAIIGYFRTLELTYSDKKGYHPHIHAILEVSNSYKTSRYYIPKAPRPQDKGKKLRHDWVSLWQKAAKLEDSMNPKDGPSVDIRFIRPLKEKDRQKVNTVVELQEEKLGGKSLSGAIAEVAKYASKVGDLLESKHPEEVVKVVDDALRNRRLRSYGGHLKEVYTRLKEPDVEDASLIEMPLDNECHDDKCPVCNSELVTMQYLWDAGLRNYRRGDIVPNAPVYKKSATEEYCEKLEEWERKVKPIHVIVAQQEGMDKPFEFKTSKERKEEKKGK